MEAKLLYKTVLSLLLFLLSINIFGQSKETKSALNSNPVKTTIAQNKNLKLPPVNPSDNPLDNPVVPPPVDPPRDTDVAPSPEDPSIDAADNPEHHPFPKEDLLPPADRPSNGSGKIIKHAKPSIKQRLKKINNSKKKKNALKKLNNPSVSEDDTVGADLVPPGQELVNIDFPEPTDIKDIIRAVSLWTGKNVILGPDVRGKVQMISPRKVTKVEAYQAFLSSLNLLGLTTVETGKVIKIIPVRSAVKSNLKTFMGSGWTPLTDELITQIVPLKYIEAKAIQTTLSRIVSTNSMIAYEPTNTLIISDSGYKVRRILDIIELLDVKIQQPQLSIVPIKYGEAKAIASMVSDIFKAQNSNKRSHSGGFMKYKILTDDRTNSVIIFGPPRTIADVKKLVRQFDVEVTDPSIQSIIHVRPLDYADAKKLSSTLSSLSGNNSRHSIRRPPLSSSKYKSKTPVADFGDDLKITADEASNSLLITGSKAAYETINSLIRKLDIRRSQVFVEAEILDINITGGFKFGTSIFAGGMERGTKMAYTWEGKSIAPLIVQQAASSTSNTSIGQSVSSFAEDMTIGILSGQSVHIPGIGDVSPGALIKMIKTDASSQVLSSPHILTANNEEAMITVGNRLYFKSPEAGLQGTVINKLEHEDVNLSLSIKPNISHSNYITLQIKLDASTGSIDSERQLPTILKRKTSQVVTVKNAQTVVISGLVKTEQLDSFKKIPLLGDIPIIGWLFRNSSKLKRKSNLMIFLTPYVIHGANDLAAVYKKKVKERDEFLEKIYGKEPTKDDFFKRLPKLNDGVYQADAFDKIDEKNREKRMQDLMHDMGYSPNEIQEIEKNKKKSKSKIEGKFKKENTPKNEQSA